MIIEKIHKQIPQLTDMRAREIRVDKSRRTVSFVLSYPNVSSLNVSLRNKVESIIAAELPPGFSCSVRYADDAFVDSGFTRNLSDYIKARFPVFASVSKSNLAVHVEGRQIDVKIKVDPVTKTNMQNAEFCEILDEHYKDYTCYSVNFELVSDEMPISASVSEQEKLVQLAINKELLRPSRFFHIDPINTVVGKQITVDPMYIGDLRQPLERCVLCGTISDKSCRQAKNNPLLYVCRFVLTDSVGGSIPCVLFVRMQITDVQTIMSETGRDEKDARELAKKRDSSNDKKLKAVTFLADGSTVAVHGKATFGQNGQLEMHVYDMCTCRIHSISPAAQFNRKVASNYLLVQPEDCTEYRQVNFVDVDNQSSLTADRRLAVLHVNATGFGNVAEDKLYAICAVKVEQGHVTERLFSYVNPEKALDEKMLRNCQLAQNKLIFYPTLTEIISDLYKFLYGFELVGNNLAPVVELLNYYAAPMNYRFSNGTVAQNDLLEVLWNGSVFGSLSVNVAKLEELAKKCKIPCDGTLFCRDSALTVARCIAFLSFKSK